jgi:hypothetical protein
VLKSVPGCTEGLRWVAQEHQGEHGVRSLLQQHGWVFEEVWQRLLLLLLLLRSQRLDSCAVHSIALTTAFAANGCRLQCCSQFATGSDPPLPRVAQQ